MAETLLVLNTGSSSLKFQVLDYQTLNVLLQGKVTGISTDARLSAHLAGGGPEIVLQLRSNDHDAALSAVIDVIDAHDDGWRIRAAVHRIVHGGTRFTQPVMVTEEIMAALEALIPLAPLHQPHNLAGIAASARLAGHMPDIACFDTAFHASLDPLASSFAIERDLRESGIRRYGFHGLSYEWISNVLAREHALLHAGKVVVAHLGNGASLCAMHGGRSVDTTMGMTALDGIPMGTRSGAIDPGAVIYMMREMGLDASQIEEALYERSGLKGLSGISNDMEALLASRDSSAAFAIDYFAQKVAQYAAMMAVSLGGMDALVFTGGIGEHAAAVRNAIVSRLGLLQPFEMLVIPANEERMMAEHARALLKARD